MPTFTTIALETLLEPRIRDSYKTSSKPLRRDNTSDRNEEKEKKELKLKLKPPTRNHIYISPALYITPVPKPIPDSSADSISPSPYVVNRKRRGREGVNNKIDGFDIGKQRTGDGENGGGELEVEVVEDNFLGAAEIVGDGNEGFKAEDGFFEPRCDSLSVGSSSYLNDIGGKVDNLSSASNQGEFFDADEDFSYDGSISNAPSFGQSTESELRTTRLSLLEEIERRKTAEDALDLMHTQWQRVRNCLLSQVGLIFPSPSNATSNMLLDINWIEQFSQEVVVARFVSEAIGKGEARAEAELAAEAIIQPKDLEISRLRDRLQYYEAVNHEMSQRNQEVKEVARRQRQRKKGQRRWLWGCIGLSVVIGSSVIVYSCIPQTNEPGPFLTSSNPSDASCTSSSESI